MKDVKFCFAFIHDPGTFHSKKKLLLPTDVKGLKVRPATSTIGQMVTLLGGTNVQASAPEARDMLERGVADAITFPWGSIILFGIDKVVTHHMDAPLYTTPFVWVMNKDKYDAMSAAQKKVIDEHCTTEWAEKVASPWADFEFAGRAKLAGEAGPRVVQADRRAARRLAQGSRADGSRMGRGREQGRLRPEAGDGVAEEHGREVQVGPLNAVTAAHSAGSPAQRDGSHHRCDRVVRRDLRRHRRG